ncbi:phosphatidate cytidylyltransferase [Pedobacter psychrophilus]|uniref:Phosphatidate cytidylyltransferase n=1 Tax=Pedobacter psychrophilus TaxID=1826909 RepID=A0A179DEL8_9SPHI|nr:phosphatidate cytidylyltransferase [Pedobacter psychrophilus]OAQ39150.1 phosphatidate cytidylyltransferase [Pedobacter psychrophilus]
MKKYTVLSLFTLVTMLLSSCSLLEGVFKGGVYVGIFIVIFVIFIIGFILYKIMS